MNEESVPHTGLLRLGLVPEHSLAFWQNARQDSPVRELQVRARAESWFGEISTARSNYLVSQLQKRFPFEARQLLISLGKPGECQTRLICHWHLQLADPLYRNFVSDFLLIRWSSPDCSVSLDQSNRWVSKIPLVREWKENTTRRLASGLLSAASEAGLCAGSGKGERSLRLLKVNPVDRSYLERLLTLAGAEANISAYLSSVSQAPHLEEDEKQ